MSQFTESLENEIKFLEAEVNKAIHTIETTAEPPKKDAAWKHMLFLRSQIGNLKTILRSEAN